MKYKLENVVGVYPRMIKNEKNNPREVFKKVDYQLAKFINGERKMVENKEQTFNLLEMANFSYFFSIADHFSPHLFTFTNNLLLEEIKKTTDKNETSGFGACKFANLMYFWQFYKQKTFDLDKLITNWAFK